MKKINSSNAPGAVGPYSQAVEHNGFLYVSGQLHIDPKTGKLSGGSIEDKTRLVMENLGSILKEAGLDYCNVIKSTIFVKDLNDFSKINAVYGSYFEGDVLPARETVEVARLPLNGDVEISVIASK